ncbi:MAG: hypothetical protein HYX27_22965 [Acidobacteria bacterium]|nr:hypothetical protein [Acidobacteriota bacterium]
MVLTKDELLSALRSEVRLLLHLISKVEPAMLDYRPSARQRSLLELLQYMTIMPPIHLRGVMTGHFDRAVWGKTWNAEESIAKTLSLEEVKESIGNQNVLFAEVLAPCTDAQLREEIQMFGPKASRGSMIVALVLSHYAAYRMQVFLYLKAAGREELNTMNLWAGMDGPM